MKDEKGQTLAVITLVVLTVLTVAMAIATRSLSGVRQTAKQEESLRAYSAAEAGAEEALRMLQDGESVPFSSTGDLLGQNSHYEFSVASMEGLTANEFVFRVEKDQAYQIDLDSVPTGTLIDIYWWKTASANPEEQDLGASCGTDESSMAALEFSYLRKSGTTYSIQRKEIYDPCGSRGNNFSPVTAGIYDFGTDRFVYKVPTAVTLLADDMRILRITTRYNGAWALVQAKDGGGNPVMLPSQGFVINSKGSSGDTERNVKVSRSVASLPSIFDFALFSGSDGALQK